MPHSDFEYFYRYVPCADQPLKAQANKKIFRSLPRGVNLCKAYCNFTILLWSISAPGTRRMPFSPTRLSSIAMAWHSAKPSPISKCMRQSTSGAGTLSWKPALWGLQAPGVIWLQSGRRGIAWLGRFLSIRKVCRMRQHPLWFLRPIVLFSQRRTRSWKDSTSWWFHCIAVLLQQASQEVCVLLT